MKGQHVCQCLIDKVKFRAGHILSHEAHTIAIADGMWATRSLAVNGPSPP